MLSKKQTEWLKNRDPHKYDEMAENYNQMMKGRILKKLKDMEKSLALMAKNWSKLAPIYNTYIKKGEHEDIRIYDEVFNNINKSIKDIRKIGIYDRSFFFNY